MTEINDFVDAGSNSPENNTSDDEAQSLSVETQRYFVGDEEQQSAVADKSTDESRQIGPKSKSLEIQARLNENFGIRVRPAGGIYQFYYRAGGKDNVVLRTPKSLEHLKDTETKLAQLATESLTRLEKAYDVSFSNPGLTKIRVESVGEDGEIKLGSLARTVKPTYPQLFALEAALERSRPSQRGMKFSFLDRRTSLPPYGNKPTLGFYQRWGGDGPSFYVTPAGSKLVPTLSDNPSVPKRSLQWCVMHELTHNSQGNMWGTTRAPGAISTQLGWQVDSLSRRRSPLLSFKGVNGELFGHGSDRESDPTVWFARNYAGFPVDERGRKVKQIRDAKQFTNEEVMAKAKVPPFTYYFMNPTEMLSEGLTAFRHGPKMREELLQSSPQLYKVVKNYDQEEINKYFGTGSDRESDYTRNLDGKVVKIDPVVRERIDKFESAHKDAEKNDNSP